jgi:hypothetical protein
MIAPIAPPGAGNSHNAMKNNLLISVIISLGAVATFLFVRSPMTVDAAIGFAAVLVLFAMVATEYRINWKRLFGRN